MNEHRARAIIRGSDRASLAQFTAAAHTLSKSEIAADAEFAQGVIRGMLFLSANKPEVAKGARKR